MVQFYMPENGWSKIIDRLGIGEDLYDTEDEKYGAETEPHVTVLYGLHNEVPLDRVKEFLPSVQDMTAIITGISHFEQPDYDVVKFTLDAPKYHAVNSALRENVPYDNEHPDYVPHMTIAYVKSGTGKKYDNDSLSIPIRPVQYKYGFADGTDAFFVI